MNWACGEDAEYIQDIGGKASGWKTKKRGWGMILIWFLRRWVVGCKLDIIGSGSCPVACFGIGGFKSSESATRVLID
jgi:hypothetical protein